MTETTETSDTNQDGSTITETATTEEATTAPTTDNEQYLQDLKNGLVLQTPPNFGKVFFDFAPPDQQQPCQTMFVIETDDNPNDFSAVPKIYGAAWAETPDRLNQVAIELWPSFGLPAYREDEDNVDGAATAAGECYAGSATLGLGQKVLSMSVRRIQHAAELRNFRTDLVKQILASRGLSTKGDKAEMIKRAQDAKILQ